MKKLSLIITAVSFLMFSNLSYADQMLLVDGSDDVWVAEAELNTDDMRESFDYVDEQSEDEELTDDEEPTDDLEQDE